MSIELSLRSCDGDKAHGVYEGDTYFATDVILERYYPVSFS